MKRKAQTKLVDTNAHLQLLDSLLEKCPDPANAHPEHCITCMDKALQALEITRTHSLPEKQMEVLHRLANCHFSLKNIDTAIRYAEDVLVLQQAGYNLPKIFHVYFIYARMHWIKGNFETAVQNYLIALALCEQNNDLQMVSGICMNLSSIYRTQGKMDSSIEYTQKAIQGFASLNDTEMVLRVKGNLANIYFSQSQFSAALELRHECISYFEAQNNPRQLAMEYNAASVIYCQSNRLDKAIDYALKSVKIREVLNDVDNIAQTWLNLGVYYNESGKDKEALDYYLKSLNYFTSVEDTCSIAQINNNIGNIYLNRNENQQALDYFQKSYELASELDDINLMATVLENLGIIYSSRLPDLPRAVDVLNRALLLAEQASDLFKAASIRTKLIDIKNHNAEFESALALLKEVEAIISEHKFEKLYAPLYSLYAENFTGSGDYPAALDAYKRFINELKKQYEDESIAKIAEMQTKYETEKKEKEAEILRQKNLELEAKNREIEEQKATLQDTLDKLQNSEIRYNFVSEELTKNIRTTLIGKSEAIRNIAEMISLVARSEKTNVLITGETGTGKEIVARNIHACSKRAKNPFYAVNCSAVPETLFESQFFGHEKDAFTGATSTKIGWFEIADKSTLFLDEVCSLSFDQQAKLLRTLEERSIIRVGSHREIPIDVRIISAANVNLLEKVNMEEFRRDLYHRLAIFVINIPPLRERKEEIPLLLHHFVGLAASSMNKVINKIDKSIASELMHYSFPGNVRELKNMVERAVLIANSSTLRLEHFMIPLSDSTAHSSSDSTAHSSSNSTAHSSSASNAHSSSASNAHSSVIPAQAGIHTSDLLSFDEMEKQLLIKTLKVTGFNRVQAAKLLKVDRKVIERKIKKYGITEEEM